MHLIGNCYIRNLFIEKIRNSNKDSFWRRIYGAFGDSGSSYCMAVLYVNDLRKCSHGTGRICLDLFYDLQLCGATLALEK